MTLATDIEVLRGLRADCDFYAGPRRRVATLDRVIAILEPLTRLSDEQVEYLLKGAEDVGDVVWSWPLRVDAQRALAASLTALRGK